MLNLRVRENKKKWRADKALHSCFRLGSILVLPGKVKVIRFFTTRALPFKTLIIRKVIAIKFYIIFVFQLNNAVTMLTSFLTREG